MTGAAKTGRWRSLVVIVVIVAAVATSLASVLWLGAATSAAKAVVHASDGSVYELSLDGEAEQVVVTDKGVNVVAVRDGAVYVREADCPNQDCVHQGTISQVGQQIVCLPHEMWIEIEAEGADGSADASDGGSAGFDTVGS